MQSSYFITDPQATLACITLSGLEFITTRNILYLEADNMYAIIHLEGGKRIHSMTSLKQYEEILMPTLFFRTHKKYIINTNKIVRYKKEHEALILNDGTQLPLARSRRHNFFLSLSR